MTELDIYRAAARVNEDQYQQALRDLGEFCARNRRTLLGQVYLAAPRRIITRDLGHPFRCVLADSDGRQARYYYSTYGLDGRRNRWKVA